MILYFFFSFFSFFLFSLFFKEGEERKKKNSFSFELRNLIRFNFLLLYIYEHISCSFLLLFLFRLPSNKPWKAKKSITFNNNNKKKKMKRRCKRNWIFPCNSFITRIQFKLCNFCKGNRSTHLSGTSRERRQTFFLGIWYSANLNKRIWQIFEVFLQGSSNL